MRYINTLEIKIEEKDDEQLLLNNNRRSSKQFPEEFYVDLNRDIKQELNNSKLNGGNSRYHFVKLNRTNSYPLVSSKIFTLDNYGHPFEYQFEENNNEVYWFN